MSWNTCLHRGPLTRVNSNERRFFVLRPDVLEYYHSQEAYDRGETFRATMRHSDVEQIEVVEQGFAFLFFNGQRTYLMAESNEDRDAWVAKIKPLLGSSQTPSSGRGGNKSDVGPLHSRSASTTTEAIICHGVLELYRKGQWEERYCVLSKEALSIYHIADDWRAAKDPQGLCFFREIQCFEVADTNFTINMLGYKHSRTLRAQSDSETQKWMRCFSEVLEPQLGSRFNTIETPVKIDPAIKSDGVLKRAQTPLMPQTPMTPATLHSVETEMTRYEIPSHEHTLHKRQRGVFWRSPWTCQGCGAASRDTNGPNVVFSCNQGCDFTLCNGCYSQSQGNTKRPRKLGTQVSHVSSRFAASADVLGAVLGLSKPRTPGGSVPLDKTLLCDGELDEIGGSGKRRYCALWTGLSTIQATSNSASV